MNNEELEEEELNDIVNDMQEHSIDDNNTVQSKQTNDNDNDNESTEEAKEPEEENEEEEPAGS